MSINYCGSLEVKLAMFVPGASCEVRWSGRDDFTDLFLQSVILVIGKTPLSLSLFISFHGKEEGK